MGRPCIDITGQKFSKLTAISLACTPGRLKNTDWNCICECGNTCVIKAFRLKNGTTKSCGCIRTGSNIHPNHRLICHNKRLFTIWRNMIIRCTPKYRDRHRYYDRGISVCPQWEVANNFYTWAISNEYRDDLTIDRVNNDSNYEPSNCRWATRKMQAQNRSTSISTTEVNTTAKK